MTANELRIGNWVTFDSDSFSEQVRLKTFAILEKYPESIASIKPIPLTPEILPQLSGKFHLPIRIMLGHVFFDYGNSYHLPKRLEYIHQFQNLYFALTGTELEYNPIKETVQRKIDSDFTQIKITDDTIFGRLNTK